MIAMVSSSRSAEERPAVDARLVAPESGYEIIDGRVVEVAPADEPHGTRHSKVAAVLEASVAEDYDVAVDMLTRTSKTDDFAPDASVFPRARDARTGGRRIEELAFEVVSTQSLSDAGGKASKLLGRGIRRVFAVDIPHERVFEWNADARTWQLFPDDGAIEDRCLAVAVPVAALVKAARADDAVARALLGKGNPVLVDALDRSRHDGKIMQARKALAMLIAARGLPATARNLARVEACADLGVLETWLQRAASAETPGEIFDPE
jgi:Uma2 family endonuclease